MDKVVIVQGFPYLKKVSDNNCLWLCVAALLGVLIILYGSKLIKKRERFSKIETNAGVNDNVEVLPSVVRNAVCHPKCCMQSQWPVGFMDNDNNPDLSNYIKSEYSCKSCDNGVGCLCFAKEDYEQLTN